MSAVLGRQQELFPKPAWKEVINLSGLRPAGRAVLVQAYEPELDRAKRETRLVIPETVSERTTILENRARVVAVGESAWSDEVAPRAKVGDLVLITKFAGFVARGADGQAYRLVNDRDIFCVIEFEAEV